MNVSEQGTDEARHQRHHVVPRTLVFVTSVNAQTGAEEVLLLRGAPNKRLWPNLYNGLGGHVEAGEDVLAAARREVEEEAGLRLRDVELRGVINVDTGADDGRSRPGVLVFVFRALADTRAVRGTEEGAPEWIAVDALAEVPLVDDLYELVPRVLSDSPLFFGHYSPRPDGTLRYRFVS